MAKMFYTMDETKAALNRDEEGIKQLSREGRLREFRDGNRLMFKADQVEQLKAEMGGQPQLSPAQDSGAPINLAGDSHSGSVFGLADSSTKGDTHMGLGGSAAGIPSPGRVAPPVGSGSGLLNLGSGAGTGFGSGGTRAGGITIFEADESQKADPSAQTAINPNVQDQISLEGVGSGSGLLDLTRESDDTSLGAVFDELSPGARKGGGASVAALETQAGEEPAVATIDRGARATLAAPIYVEAADPVASALGAAAVVPVIVMLFGAFVLISAVMGYRPDLLNTLRISESFYMYSLAAAVVTGIAAGAGFFIGKK